MEMNDKLVLEGVLTKGYGTIPKLVMKDESLTIEAKGIYAYLCSYAGAGETAFPSVGLIMKDLDISENRFYKHRKLLVEKGYIKVDRERLDSGFSKNIYTICSTVHRQNEGIQNEGIQNEGIQNEGIQNEGTNNNSINNNSINNNSLNNNNNNSGGDNPSFVKDVSKEKEKKNELKRASNFYQSNFGIVTEHIMQDISYWIDDVGIDLVMRALELAVEHQKNYAYAKGIMKNWEKNNIKTLEDVEAADVAFANKNKAKFNQANGNRKDEVLPDWSKEDYEKPKNDEIVPEKDLDDYENRLERLRNLRKLKLG